MRRDKRGHARGKIVVPGGALLFVNFGVSRSKESF
jgi:hypothetical protein